MDISLGIIFGIVSLLGWGIADLLAKVVITKFGGIRALFIQQLVGLLFIGAYCFIFLTIPVISFELMILLAVTSIFATFGYVMFYKAMEYGNVSIVSPIVSSWAALTVVLSVVFFSEVLSILQFFSILLIFFGIFLTSIVWKDFKKSLKGGISNGVKEAIVSMVCWGIGFTLLKLTVDSLGTIIPIVFFRLFSVVIILAVLFRRKLEIIFKPFHLLLIIIFSGILDVLALLTYNIAITSEFVSIVAPISSAFPLVTIILAQIFLKERMVLNQKIGAAFILTGLILISLI